MIFGKSENGGSRTVTVSAIIPTHNGRLFAGATLDAVLGQSRPPEETIVVDDGSTDGTADFVEESYPGIRVVRQANQGVATARNRGAAEAKGDYLAFCDSDDVWLPWKLELQVSVIEHLTGQAGSPPPALASSRLWPVPDESFESRVRSAWGMARPRAGTPRPLTVEEALMGCEVMASSLLVRRDHFVALGGFDTALRQGSEDFDLWLRLVTAGAGGLLCLDRPLFIYRVRAGSVSSTAQRVAAAQTALLRKWSPVRRPDLITPDLFRRACTKQAVYVAYRYGAEWRCPPASFLADFLREFPTLGPSASTLGFALWLARTSPRIFARVSRLYARLTGSAPGR